MRYGAQNVQHVFHAVRQQLYVMRVDTPAGVITRGEQVWLRVDQ